jgi:hypothetical protein
MSATSDLSPYTDHARGSKAALYGLPAAVASFFQVEKNFEYFVKEATKDFQKQIRSEAKTSWGDDANTIFVKYDSATENLRIFSTSPKAHILEYGDTENPPRPILRKAANQAQTQFAEHLSKLIEKALS